MALKFPQTNFANPKIIDPFGGQKDLEKKLIRAVGNPSERFSEDALRLMRAIRIASQLGFTIEEKTQSAITANATLINKIAKERVRDELFKILLLHDTRESCQRIKKHLITGILHNAGRVVDAGILPTPAALWLMQCNISFDLALVISASHNPYPDNGIKLFRRTKKLGREDEAFISE